MSGFAAPGLPCASCGHSISLCIEEDLKYWTFKLMSDNSLIPGPVRRGAGGTRGGIGSFLVGLIMMCGGWYWILQAITVTHTFSLGLRLYDTGDLHITSGMILIPLIFGIGMIFFNARNFLGWFLALGSLVALLFGVITSLHFTFRTMSLFDLIVILILAVGGTGLFLRSLRDAGAEER